MSGVLIGYKTFDQEQASSMTKHRCCSRPISVDRSFKSVRSAPNALIAASAPAISHMPPNPSEPTPHAKARDRALVGVIGKHVSLIGAACQPISVRGQMKTRCRCFQQKKPPGIPTIDQFSKIWATGRR
jgi:hypothetical protein